MSQRHAVSLVLLLLALATPTEAGERRQRRWLSGTIVNIDSQIVGSKASFSLWGGASKGVERRNYHIDVGETVYIAFEEHTAGKDFAKVTMNSPVRVAVEGELAFLVDERGEEIKLKMFSKVAKASVGTTSNGPAVAAPETTGGEIRRGMTPQDVETILGKPLRTVVFEGKTQWLYAKLVVVFQDGRVSDVSF